MMWEMHTCWCKGAVTFGAHDFRTSVSALRNAKASWCMNIHDETCHSKRCIDITCALCHERCVCGGYWGHFPHDSTIMHAVILNTSILTAITHNIF